MKRTYPVTVKLLSALHINGGTDVNGNRITLKMDQRPYVPASLFKGLVRENFSKLWQLAFSDALPCCRSDKTDANPCRCMTCRMFGAAGFQRSRVYFDHLETSQTVEFRTCSNVSIDRHLHKNVEANLVFTEVAPPIAINENGERETLMLNGNVTVYYPTELDIAEQKKIEAVFVEAVRMITNIGLGKSRGLGFAETRLNAPEGGWLCESE